MFSNYFPGHALYSDCTEYFVVLAIAQDFEASAKTALTYGLPVMRL